MDPFHVTRHFRDPDEAAMALSGARLEISVLGPASGPWSLTDLLEEGSRLQCGRTASPFSGCGEILHGSRFLCWPMSDDTGTWSVNGRRIRGATLMRLDAGVEYASLTSRPVHWAALVVPAGEPDGPASFSAREVAPEEITRIRAMTRAAVYLARTGETAASRLFLSDLAASVARSTSREDLKSPGRGRDSVARLLGVLHSQRSELLEPAELARRAGMDERTLRREFATHFGISVGRYLRMRRLNDVRRALSNPAAPAESVTQAATQHGFFDLGRFAASYRRTFGENPSATLSRTRWAMRLAGLRDAVH